MTEGFILDEDNGWRKTSKWIAGAPQKSLFLGIKLRSKQKIPIQSWRCTRCGFLESYANPASA
jgi:hypothetical protein